MIRLFYIGRGTATIAVSTEPSEIFESIDKACDFLQDSLKIADDVIDDAIIQLHAHKHTVATFNNEGKLHSTGFY